MITTKNIFPYYKVTSFKMEPQTVEDKEIIKELVVAYSGFGTRSSPNGLLEILRNLNRRNHHPRTR